MTHAQPSRRNGQDCRRWGRADTFVIDPFPGNWLARVRLVEMMILLAREQGPVLPAGSDQPVADTALRIRQAVDYIAIVHVAEAHCVATSPIQPSRPECAMIASGTERRSAPPVAATPLSSPGARPRPGHRTPPPAAVRARTARPAWRKRYMLIACCLTQRLPRLPPRPRHRRRRGVPAGPPARRCDRGSYRSHLAARISLTLTTGCSTGWGCPTQ